MCLSCPLLCLVGLLCLTGLSAFTTEEQALLQFATQISNFDVSYQGSLFQAVPGCQFPAQSACTLYLFLAGLYFLPLQGLTTPIQLPLVFSVCFRRCTRAATGKVGARTATFCAPPLKSSLTMNTFASLTTLGKLMLQVSLGPVLCVHPTALSCASACLAGD